MSGAGIGTIVVFGDPVSTELARTLDLAGYSWCGVASHEAASGSEPPNGWAGAVVDGSGDL